MLRLNECFAIKRKRENKVRAAFFTICFVAAVFLVSTPYAYAQLVPDQTNDVSTGVSFGGEGLVLSQGFIPTVSTVDAIDLRLRLGGSFPPPPGGYYTTINLRSGTPSGPILGSATTFVQGTFDPIGSLPGQLVRFEFSPPVCVSPGQTYFIQWIAPPPNILEWMGDQNDNPYPAGTFYIGLLELPLDDVCFITYAYAGFPLIGRTVWADLEFVRFRNYMYKSQPPYPGWLESALTLYGSNGSNSLVFSNPSLVTSFQADVTVKDYQNNGSYPYAGLFGYVYNNGTSGGGATGDVIGIVGIGHNGTQLQGFYSITRCTAPNCNLTNEWQTVCSGSLGSAVLNTTYPISFSWDGSSFTFGFGGSNTVINSSNCPALPTNVGPPKVERKGIHTRISDINSPNEGGFISATFDNVLVNGEIYDDFDSNDLTEKIDPSKWITWEFVRAASGCELVSALTQRGVNGSNNLSFLNSQTVSEFQADLKVVEFQNNGARPQGRLYAAFYNDGTGTSTPGDLTGDVYGIVGILDNGQGMGPQAFYAVSKCTAPNCNLPGEYQILYSGIFKNVALNEIHRFSLSWNRLNIILGCDGSAILYNPTSQAPIVSGNGLPKGRKGIGTRVTEIQNTNEWAYVSAQFANIVTVVDTDGDGVPDSVDNCPAVYNPVVAEWVDYQGIIHKNSQPDFNLNNIGDACDLCPRVPGTDGGPCPTTGPHAVGGGTATTTGPLIKVTFTYNGPDTFLVPPNCNNVVFTSEPEIPQNCRFREPYILKIVEEPAGSGVGRPGGDWIPVTAGYTSTINCNPLEIFDEDSLKAAGDVTITPMYTLFFEDPGTDYAGNCLPNEICVDTSPGKYNLFQGTMVANPVTLTQPQISNSKNVSIDIRPLSHRNIINIQSCGYVPVAIFSAPDFNARTIKIETVKMGDAGVKTVVIGKKRIPLTLDLDVNRDGLKDKVVFFDIKALNLAKYTPPVCLTGETTGGISFIGCDSVTIVSQKSWNRLCGCEDED